MELTTIRVSLVHIAEQLKQSNEYFRQFSLKIANINEENRSNIIVNSKLKVKVIGVPRSQAVSCFCNHNRGNRTGLLFPKQDVQSNTVCDFMCLQPTVCSNYFLLYAFLIIRAFLDPVFTVYRHHSNGECYKILNCSQKDIVKEQIID